MFCYNDDQTNQKRSQRHKHRLQNAISHQPSKSKSKYLSKQGEIDQMKLLQSKHVEMFKEFKRNLKQDSKQNREEAELLVIKIGKAESVKQIDEIGSPYCMFTSIKEYLSYSGFGEPYKAEYIPIIQDNLGAVYLQLIKAKKRERKLTICVKHYINLIDSALRKDSIPKCQTEIRESFKQLELYLYEKMQDLLSQTKIRSSYQNPKLQDQSNAQQKNNALLDKLQEYKLAEKENKEKINKLQEQKQQAKNRNFQLTLQLQNIKQRLKAQIEFGKERLKQQMVNTKERLKQERQMLKEQKEFFKIQLEESKGRLKLQLEETKQRLKAQLQQAKERLKGQFENTKQRLLIELQKAKEQKTILKAEVQKCNEKLNASQEQAKQRIKTQLQDAKKKVKEQVLRIKAEFEAQMEKKQQENQNLKLQIQNTKQLLKMEIEMIHNQKEVVQKQNQNLRIQIQSFNHIVENLQQQVDFLKNMPSSKKMLSQSEVAIKTLFNGQIMAKNKQRKAFLIESIKCHMDKDILMTEKLYDFKRDQKVGFHQFIHDHSNLTIIVQTHSALFACYYSGPYKPHTMKEEALIISLDNQKVFKLNNAKNYPDKDPKDKRSIQGMVYSDESLIFGNSQVRIHKNENIVFSNFGTTNCYFNAQGCKVGDLLNEGDINEVELINYEIHEVFLGEKQFEVDLQDLQATP